MSGAVYVTLSDDGIAGETDGVVIDGQMVTITAEGTYIFSGTLSEGQIVVERNSEGEVMMPRYNCVTTHTARRSGITNMYLTHKYSILQMMHVSGHKTQKTFMDYIKLSSDEIADEIDAIANGAKADVF